jgi:hypothetical protein
MTRALVPTVAGVSVVLDGGVLVCARDARLLAKALQATPPNLDTFLYAANFTGVERVQVMQLVSALDNFAGRRAAEPARTNRLESDIEISSLQAAARLGLTSQRVGQLVRQGQLEGSKTAGRLRVRQASVERLHARRTRGA